MKFFAVAVAVAAALLIIIALSTNTGQWLLFEGLWRMGEQHKALSQKNTRRQLNKQTAAITIEWADNLDDNFSFTSKWVYDEPAMHYLAERDSLAVTGNKEDLINKWMHRENEMRDNYQNTTRFPYTFQVNNVLSHINVEQIRKNNIECQSGIIPVIEGLPGACLNLVITDKACYPVIGVEEIYGGQFLGKHNATPSPFQLVSPCVEGTIKIDRTMLSRALLKASFNFTFTYPNSTGGRYTLTGKIYSPIRWMRVESPVITEEEQRQYEYMICLDSKYR